MATIRQLLQKSPTRANELFVKLVDTSDSAVKTREKLFLELKEELEQLATLEEQHLFPLLRKHKDLKDLVREALSDNKATRKLLTELEHTPKDSEEFATRVAELRRVFQQHVRNEKKDLLPSVLKALSDEEAEAVVEGFEAGKTEIEEAKRAEAEERRAAARQQREEAQRIQDAADSVVSTAWAAPITVQQTVRTTVDAVQSGVSAVSEGARRTTDQVNQLMGAARQSNEALTERAAQSLQAVTRSGTGLARGMQQVSTECFEMINERVQKNLDGISALARCRTLPELLEAQGSLLRSNLEMTLANSRRLADISARFAGTATRTMTAEADHDRNRAA